MRWSPELPVSWLALIAVTALSEIASAQERSLTSCLTRLRATAAGRRIPSATWDRETPDLTRDPRVLAQVASQPEFRLPIWDYVAIMADEQRVDDGRQRVAQEGPALQQAAERYGVEPAILVAIWGIESDFGRVQGSFEVLRSVATLACEGRRRSYFSGELLAALRIVSRGDIASDRLRGSWAGAFGQTQFMPGSFERLAVDLDGDGRRDVINSAADALGSAANYLRRAGWRRGMPWGFEVRLPPGHAFGPPARGSWRTQRRSLARWAAAGLTRTDGTPLARDSTLAGLFAPAGLDGPVFLVTRNFEALYRYNAAEYYALSAAHLADRIAGGGPFATAWPTDDPGLSRAERREVQHHLRALGHDSVNVAGVLTPRMRGVVRAEQARLGMPVTGRPGQRLLRALRAASTP